MLPAMIMGAQSLPIIRPLSMFFSSCASYCLLSKVLRTQQPAPAAAVGTRLSFTLTPLKPITAGGGGGEGGGVKIMASTASSVLKVSSSIEERDKDSREIGKTENISKNHETKRKDRNVEDVEQGEPDLKKSKSLDSVFPLSDIKEKYKDAKLLPKWKAFQTIIFLERDDGLHDSNKIAAFDFDGCLADTDVRRVGADAWKLMYPSIPDKLQSLYNDGYKLVIFTNESNIERWKNKRQVAVDSKIGRLNNFIMLVKVPIQVFIACGLSRGKVEDPFRKPKPGMWDIMEKHFNSGIPVDMDRSFYVGDAAGRKTDHSDADLKFAQAVGLKFYVPEEYFCA